MALNYNPAELLRTMPCGYFTEPVVRKLEKARFFEAPASTRFHGAYPGGLFEHSFEVMKQLVFLTYNEKLNWQNPRSPYIIGMLHDLCKYDAYIINPDTGKISWNKNQKISGHGDKSVMLAKYIFPDLTEEEELCIRWHMGSFDEKENWNGYTNAIHKFPNVLWTHVADMLASHVAGI